MAQKASAGFSTIAILLLILISPSFASFPSVPILNSDSICNLTPHPDFCKSILPSDKSITKFDFGRICLRQSLSNAYSLLGSVKYFLRLPSTSYLSTIRALEDCKFLAELNVDFLSYTLRNINAKEDNNLDSSMAETLHALLSAVLTNTETCLEGLGASEAASTVKKGLLPSILTGDRFHGISLAIFKHAWIHEITKPLTGRNHGFLNLGKGKNSPLPLIMSGHDQAIYESVSGQKPAHPDVGEGVNVSRLVVVNPNGSGDFTTINEAVAAAPNNTGNGTQYFVIYVVSGVYEEYVVIPKKKQNLMMIGDGIDKTIITGNRSVADGNGMTTFNSATFAVVGSGFVAVNITFRNTAGAINHQAVAVRNGADKSTFYRCSFEGYQDTLYTHSLRQFYKECDIYGTIDFIFGNAAVVFQDCNIYPRLPLEHQFNTITAQGRRDPNQSTGISIQNCVIKAANDLASSNRTTKTYLGRPWKEFSRTIVMQSFMDDLIEPSGWAEWVGNFALDTLYYAEYRNSGPGSNTDSRVNWQGYHKNLTGSDAAVFTVDNLIQGGTWLDPTGVPYNGDLD
ncbi:Pectinesterase, catalytic [Corchorus olitorius]|uniref:Pectinesterase n=1 Tax=Corchorus olitorius TaxID=93759 RepID=A0A1R3K832_9ROSI|nr:Pectinesterase, catalytic [Corchorus olitorius]